MRMPGKTKKLRREEEERGRKNEEKGSRGLEMCVIKG